MPTTTWASDFDLVNLGPLTTTFTAPPECTLPVQGVGLGPDAYEPDYILWNQQCDIVTAGNCLPSGSTMDDDYNSRTGQPNRGYQLYYYSPAAACPADWKTVGLVSRANDGSLSYSGVFDPSWVTRPEASVTTKTVFNPLVHRWANALGPQETGIACCPSDWIPDINAFCFSNFPAGKFPGTTACGIENTNWPPGTYVPGSFPLGNQTVTGIVLSLTTTLDLISSETTFPSGYWATADGDQDWEGIATQNMIFLATGGAAPAPTQTVTETEAASQATGASARTSPQSGAGARMTGLKGHTWGVVASLAAFALFCPW
ncbi:GPI-anchor transamidase [Verticillium dahliae VDG1]|nr:GPI-anchor transamidase [Verticillium dahliae VDG1]